MMRIRFIVLTVSVTAALTGQAQAQTRSNDLMLYGVATSSCGNFLESQEKQNQRYGFYVAWLQGYLSAVNLYGVIDKRTNIGQSTDVASMLLWLKNHCSQNPLDDFTASVLDLTGELRKK